MIGEHCRHDILIPFAPRIDDSDPDGDTDVIIQEHPIQIENGVGKANASGHAQSKHQLLAVAGRIFRSAERIPPFLVYPPRDFVWARIQGQSYSFDAMYPPDDRRLTGACQGGDNIIATWALFERVPFWVRVNCERQFYGV